MLRCQCTGLLAERLIAPLVKIVQEYAHYIDDIAIAQLLDGLDFTCADLHIADGYFSETMVGPLAQLHYDTNLSLGQGYMWTNISVSGRDVYLWCMIVHEFGISHVLLRPSIAFMFGCLRIMDRTIETVVLDPKMVKCSRSTPEQIRDGIKRLCLLINAEMTSRALAVDASSILHRADN